MANDKKFPPAMWVNEGQDGYKRLSHPADDLILDIEFEQCYIRYASEGLIIYGEIASFTPSSSAKGKNEEGKYEEAVPGKYIINLYESGKKSTPLSTRIVEAIISSLGQVEGFTGLEEHCFSFTLQFGAITGTKLKDFIALGSKSKLYESYCSKVVDFATIIAEPTLEKLGEIKEPEAKKKGGWGGGSSVTINSIPDVALAKERLTFIKDNMSDIGEIFEVMKVVDKNASITAFIESLLS